MGDDSVSLTAQGVLGVEAAVQNAITTVLGPNGDPSSSLSSAQDILNLDTSLKLKFKKLTQDIQKGLEDVSKNIVSAIGTSSQESAGVASILHGDETESPLNRIASTLDEIHAFLVEKFKPTGLGSEDDNKGMLDRPEKEKEKEKVEKEKGKKSEGSAWLGGTIVAATLMSIKDYLEETWVGLAQRFLKPFVAVQLAIKGLPKSLSGLSLNFQRFTSKLAAKFPRLSKAMTNLMKPIRWVTTKVKGFGRSITSAVKNFKISKFFAPVTKWLSKLGGTAGFGSLFRWLSPIGGLLKKLAYPITLVLEAFEAFKMIFVGSFTKNAEALSESISEKGILGRAWYGFTHMFQTIATFGYELVETFKAIITAAGTFMEPIKDGFMNLIDTISSYFIKIYNAIARKSMGLISEIKTDGMVQMDRREALKRSISGDKVDDAKADRMTDQLIDRGAKVGVEIQDGDNMTSFKNRILAGEQQTKRNEKVQLAREKQKPEYGVGRYKNQGAPVTQNNVQQTVNTTFEIKLPTPGEVIDQ